MISNDLGSAAASKRQPPAAIAQYVCDRAPAKNLAPPNGTFERAKLQSWLNFISSEVHKQFNPLWYPDTPEATKQTQRARLAKRFDYMNPILAKQPYLMGETFTVADAYLHTILNWSGMLKVDLAPWPALVEFQQRIAARPGVAKTHQAEHTTKAAAAA